MRTRTLRRIIYPRLAAVMLLLLLTFALLAGMLFRQYIYRQSVSNLREVFTLIDTYLELHDQDGLDTLQSDLFEIASGSQVRISLIRSDGVVLIDSEKAPSLLNNHANRPEIYSAFRARPSTHVRKSTTLNIDMLYFAALSSFSDSTGPYVLRIAMPYTELRSAYRMIYLYIALGCGFFILLSILLFFFLDRQIEKPLSHLARTANDYSMLNFTEEVFEGSTAQEIQEVFSSMRNMSKKIQQQFFDVESQKKALQAVLDGMREAVIVLNFHGEIIKANPAARTLFETTDERQLLGKYYLQVLRSSELNSIVEKALVDSEAPLETHELTIHLGELFIQVHLSRIGSQERKNVLLVLNDITTLMHLEKVRKDFVANVSHELKTPVTSIKGFAETLLYSEALQDTQKSKRFLSIIHSQTERLQAIIDDLLTLSRLEQSHDRSEDFTQIDLNSIISESVTICREKPGNERRVVTTELDQGLLIMGNSLLMEQTFINLIDNALKYSEEDRPVRITGRRAASRIEIQVIDQGFGIPPASIERIFERFYRVDKGRSRDKGGTGLGLSIVKHIVLQHKGTVEVSSTEQQGSVFTLCFDAIPPA